MSKTREIWATGALLASLAVGVASCGDDGTASDGIEGLELQPQRRFPIGSTFFLPIAEGETWTLAAGPEGNDNEVVNGSDGFARFTPVVAGNYEFALTGTSNTQALTVVEDAPFEQFNYYATNSMTEVGQEVWVAHLFDPHLSRIDSTTGEILGSIQTGSWPAAVAHSEALGVVLVAHKAGDTLGFVDVESGRLVDAVWVGDEPADIALSPGGDLAYVSLATEDAVVVVDVTTREVVGRVETNANPTSLAISDDGSTLFVASYRSSISDRLQFGTDERNDLYDIAVVDTADLEVRDYIAKAGATIGGILFSEDRLYVATTRHTPQELSSAAGYTAFRHTVAVFDTQSLAEIVAVDIGRQESAPGFAVRPFGMALSDGKLWVTAEGSDAILALDPDSLEELHRSEAPGRPRTVFAGSNGLYVHGAQGYQVTRIDGQGAVQGEVVLGGDPRTANAALGQRLYTGTGADLGENHSCADCHVDGLTDGTVWSTGGFSESASRPMFWMEGTAPIGWEGDAFDLYSYLYASPAPTIRVVPTRQTHDAFYEYLASLVPPPAPNGWTRRDGGMTEEAQRGAEVFSGAGNCAGCHAGPLGTQGLRLEQGGTVTEHPLVVPSLVGIYRHSFWLVNGAARSLEEAIDGMLPLAGATLDTEQHQALARYLREFTSREFFVLASSPAKGATQVRTEGEILLTLSHPVFDEPGNLERIHLRDASGQDVAVERAVDGRHITLAPAQPLSPGASYTLVVDAGFEAYNERTTSDAYEIAFEVAEQPDLRLEGDYIIDIDHPNLDMEESRYVPEDIVPVELQMTATPNAYGARFDTVIIDEYPENYDVVVEGDTAYWPPFAFPIGPPGFMNRSFPSEIQLRDEDGDGIADSGESTLYFLGPGLEAYDVVWRMRRPDSEPAACEGQEGTHVVDLSFDDQGQPAVDWTDDLDAIGYYVTDPMAEIPAGPGMITGGETFWSIGTVRFPDGFRGPIAYGQVPEGAEDTTEGNGGQVGGGPLPAASCIKVTIAFSDFATTVVQFETP